MAQAPENRLLRLPAALATACLLLKVVSVERNQLQIPPQVGTSRTHADRAVASHRAAWEGGDDVVARSECRMSAMKALTPYGCTSLMAVPPSPSHPSPSTCTCGAAVLMPARFAAFACGNAQRLPLGPADARSAPARVTARLKRA